MFSQFLSLILSVVTLAVIGFSEVSSARPIDKFEVQILKAGAAGETNFDYPNFFINEQQTRAVVYYSFRRIEYWDIQSRKPRQLKVWKPSTKEIHSAAYNERTGLLAIGYNKNNRVEVIDPESNKLLMKYEWAGQSDKKEIRSLAFSDDGTLLAALSYHGESVVIDVLKRSALAHFDIGHFSTDAAFSRDNSRLFAGARNSKLVEVQLEHSPRRNITTLLSGGGNESHYSGVFSVIGNGLILARQAKAEIEPGGQYVVFDRDTSETKYVLPANNDFYKLSIHQTPAMIPNSDQFAMILNSARSDRTSQYIGIWDSQSKQPRIITKPINGGIVSLSASNSKIFAGMSNGEIAVIDISSGEFEPRLRDIVPVDKSVNPMFQMNDCQYLLTHPTGENVLVGTTNGYVMRLKIRY